MADQRQQMKESIGEFSMDRQLQIAIAERDTTFLMVALIVESGKRAAERGITLEQFIGGIEALAQEYAGISDLMTNWERPVIRDEP